MNTWSTEEQVEGVTSKARIPTRCSKAGALTCIVLHNICIAANDTLPPQPDLRIDPFT